MKSMKNRNIIIFSLVVLALMAGYMLTMYQKGKVTKRIIQNANFTNTKFGGEIIPYKKGSNGPWYVCYFTVKDESFSATQPTRICDKLRPEFFQQNFPVIYDSLNPESARVLVFPADFREFNLAYPDSLNWIIQRLQ